MKLRTKSFFFKKIIDFCFFLQTLCLSGCATSTNTHVKEASNQQKSDSFGINDSKNLHNKNMDTPEMAIVQIQEDLISAYIKLNTYRKISKYGGYAPIDLSGLDAFDRAQIAFATNQFETVITDLNTYLNSLQITDKKKYIQAQWMLAKSHESLKNDVKSFKAYIRFMTESIKQSNVESQDFVEAVNSALKIARRIRSSENLENFISAIAAMNLPIEVANKIVPLIAMESANLGNHQIVHMLTSSLERKNKNREDPKLTQTIAYVRALALLSSGNIKLSQEFLEFIVKKADNSEIKNHSCLLLGRIFASIREWEKSIEYYSLIPKESIYFKNAILESIKAYIDIKDFNSARNQSTKFISLWPDENASYQLTINMIYLDLNAGDFDKAESNIKKVIENLTQIKRKIASTFVDGKSLSFNDLMTVQEITRGKTPKNNIIDDSLLLYHDLIIHRRNVSDLHNSLRDIYYKIASTKSNIVNNQIINKAHALSFISDIIIEKGSNLADIQSDLLKKHASDLDIKKMELSRQNFADAKKEGPQDFTSFNLNKLKVSLLDILNKSQLIYEKIINSEAKIRGAYAAETNKKNSVIKENYLATLNDTLRDQKVKLQKIQDQSRKLQAEILLQSGDIGQFEKKLLQRLVLLNESQSHILETAAKIHQSPLSLRIKELQAPWEIWRKTATEILKSVQDLRDELSARVNQTMSSIGQIEADILKAEQQIHELNQKILSNILSNSGSISGSLDLLLGENISRHQRWLAEVQWRKLQKENGEYKNLETKYNIEGEIISSQLEFQKIQTGQKI